VSSGEAIAALLFLLADDLTLVLQIFLGSLGLECVALYRVGL
jgi:hypothetical protein